MRLARKTNWRDVKLSSGEVVTAETTRQIFEDAAKALKSKSRRKRVLNRFNRKERKGLKEIKLLLSALFAFFAVNFKSHG